MGSIGGADLGVGRRIVEASGFGGIGPGPCLYTTGKAPATARRHDRVSCDATCTALLSVVTPLRAKSRIGNEIGIYPHKLWISLCMTAGDAAAMPENQGFARLWRKKRQGK